MKKILFPIITVLTLFIISAWGAEVKIGYVDLLKALNESSRGAEAKKTLEDIVKTKQTAINKMESEIERLQGEMEKQASILTHEAKKEKEEQRDKLLRDYQRMVKDSQDELKKKETELTQGILKDLREIIKKVGEEEGYTVIFEVSESGMLYSNKKLDITEKIIKTYNESLKATETKK